jgi:hypothetical protein
MVPPVKPVIQEVLCKQEHEPIGEDIGHGNPVMVITNAEDHNIDASEQQVDNAVEQHEVHVC